MGAPVYSNARLVLVIVISTSVSSARRVSSIARHQAAAPLDAPAPTTASTGASSACNSCSDDCCGECVPIPGNVQGATKAHCGACASGQTWWPCNVEGLCQCAGAADPAGSTSAPDATSTASPRTPLKAAPTPPAPSAGTSAPAVNGDLCSAKGPACTFAPGAGISSWFTKELFNEMFPHICDSACHGCDMLTYDCLIAATMRFPDFANSSDVNANKRELAAWLGEMSQETTGGGCGASDEQAGGTCSCGENWCDSEPNGGCSRWGLCFVEEAGGEYCSPNAYYPCAQGKEYKGRGPKQLSWNYNYGQFSKEFCGDKSTLLSYPDRVATNPTLAWASSIWFWFTGGACIPESGEVCKPNCHEAFTGSKRMCEADVAAGREYGLGWVTNVINGGLECGGAGQGKCDYRVHSRVRFYKRFCGILGVDPLAPGWTEDDNLFCHNQKNYITAPPALC